MAGGVPAGDADAVADVVAAQAGGVGEEQEVFAADLELVAAQGAAGDRKAFVRDGYVSEMAVGQDGLRGMDE